MTEYRNDWLTVSAIGVLAMCIVTFDHEALGHGSACLLLHGHIRLLTSSLFRCDVRSGWIDPAGPFGNLLMGSLALVACRFVPARAVKTRFLLTLVAAFSFFWESGYAMRAMYRRDGDLYFFAQFMLGSVADWQRWLAAGVALVVFVFTARITSRALLNLWPDARVARRVARTVWLAATARAAVAALAYSGNGWGDLSDSVLEIGGASFPLLFIPFGNAEGIREGTFVARSHATIILSAVVYAGFVATLGRGLGISG